MTVTKNSKSVFTQETRSPTAPASASQRNLDEHYQGDMRLSVATMLASDELMESLIKDSPSTAMGLLDTLLRIPPESFEPRFIKHVVTICKQFGSPIAEAAVSTLVHQVNSGESICRLIEHAAKDNVLIRTIYEEVCRMCDSSSEIPKPFNRSEWLRIHRLFCENRSEGMPVKSVMIDEMLLHMNDSDMVATRLEVSVYFWSHIGGSKLLVKRSEILHAITNEKDKFSQKNAKWILQKYAAKATDKKSWDLWFQLYDAIDEYSSHLFKSLFATAVTNLRIVAPSDSGGKSFEMTADMVYILIKRCLNHDNDHVVKHAIVEISQNEKIGNALIEKGIIDGDSLGEFLDLIEKRCIAVFQKSDLLEPLVAMIKSWCFAKDWVSKFLIWRILGGEVKLFFPIVHCYLKVLSETGIRAIVLNSQYPWFMDNVYKFADRTILHFPAIVRSEMKHLLRKTLDKDSRWHSIIHEIADNKPIGSRDKPTLGGRLSKVASILAVDERKPELLMTKPEYQLEELLKIVNEKSSKNSTSFTWLEYRMIDYGVGIMGNADAKKLRNAVLKLRRIPRGEISDNQYRRVLMVDSALHKYYPGSERQGGHTISYKTLNSLLALEHRIVEETPLWIERMGRDSQVMKPGTFTQILAILQGVVNRELCRDPISPSGAVSLTIAMSLLSQLTQKLIWSEDRFFEEQEWFLMIVEELFAYNLPRIIIPDDCLVPVMFELADAPTDRFVRLDTQESVYERFEEAKWELIKRTIVSGLSRKSGPHITDLLFFGIHSFPGLMDEFSTLSTQGIVLFNETVNALIHSSEACELLFGIDFVETYLSTAGSMVMQKKKDGKISPRATASILNTISNMANSPFADRACAVSVSRFFEKLLVTSESGVSRTIASTICGLFEKKSKKNKFIAHPIIIHLLAELIVYRENFDESDTDAAAVAAIGQDTNSACTRLLVLSKLRSWDEPRYMGQLISELLRKIREFQTDLIKKNAPLTPLPFSPFHRMQLRVFQALCYLAPRISDSTWENTIFPDLFGSILKWPNQPDSRDYLECLAIYAWTKLSLSGRAEMISTWILPSLTDHTMPSQSVASFVLIGGYMVSHADSPDGKGKTVYTCPELVVRTVQLVHALIPYLSSNIAYIRGVSQQWLLEASNRGILSRLGCAGDLCIQSFLSFVRSNKEAVAMRQRLVLIYNEWDPIEVIESGKILTLCKSGAMFKNGEFLPSWIFMDSIKHGVHDSLEDNWFYTRDMEQYLEEAASRGPKQDSQDSKTDEDENNSQRKYDPSVFGHIFPGAVESCESLEARRKQAATDLIVVTSLVEKTTNIAGLFRSAEVFGAKKIVIASKCVLRDPEFKNMSVTADKWIECEEINRSKLAEYIARMQRDEGYTAVCLEQTHRSIKIGEYKFPKKTLLILGNEKSGVDAEFLPLVDVCVEIPQKGVIRSLNVHVSGALAIWQYNQSSQQ